MTRTQVILVTAALMLSLFLASMEATVVATAMPTIVSQLGGLAIYSWVFSAYLLASTTTVPIYGKLSDLFGRRPVFMFAIAVFLVGSVLAGLATSMTQLVLARAVQGLGAGGILPLVFIIIGDIFSIEQRAKMQGLFSGVWGVSSIIGPLLGGFLVDRVSWQWVFWINLIPGTIAAALFWYGWREDRSRRTGPIRIDFLGAALLSAGVVMLLLGLFDLGSPASWALLAGSAAALIAVVFVERRASDPILPIHLFNDRLFAVSCLHGVLVGAAIFGSASYVPLFAQGVLGTSATLAGAALTPQLLSWVAASIINGRLLLRMGYRTLALFGMVLVVTGAATLLAADALRSAWPLVLGMALTGAGMGFAIPSFLIAVQSAVPRRSLGTATSTLTFSRNIGGTLGVSIMGVLLTAGLTSALAAAGMSIDSASVGSMIESGGLADADQAAQLADALAQALSGVFLFSLITAALALVVTLFSPRGSVQQLEADRAAQTVAE